MVNEIFSGFSPASRVWVYASSRKLNDNELLWLNHALQKFTLGWTAHEMPLKASASILHEQFVVLMVDESINAVSGCGIDKSVHFMKEAGSHLNINFFDRLTCHFLSNGEIVSAPIAKIQQLIESGKIDAHSIFFNNLVNTKESFEKQWKIPVGESWLKTKIQLPA